MAQSVTHTSPAKIKSVLIGNKKRALDAERATTPTPQSYNDVDMTMGDQNDPNRRVPWDEDIESSGDENDQRGIDQESIQADRFSHLADRSMSRDEKLDHLYNSLLDAGFFVQALESGGEMDIARTDQKITGCMTGLSNALLNQPYRVIMEQQAGLAKAIHEISKNMTTTMENMATIMENVQNNGEKIEHMKNETANSLTATSDRLKALESLATDTQSRIANLENRGAGPQTRNTEPTSNPSHTTSHATGPTFKPKGKTEGNPGPTKKSTNPASAHHPSRAVIRFLPDGIRDEDRLDPMVIVNTINNALANAPSLKAKHIRAVTATYNNQGNLIVSTRADQRAADLLQYAELFIPLIDQGYNTSVIEDKKWFKIQIDGVNTHTMTSLGPRSILTAETVHEELLACNLAYAQASDSIVAPPRWMRTQEELEGTLRSSLVFAVDDEEVAKKLLQENSLAAFARHCPLRAYQDRPPVKQCKNCWGWDHRADKCPEPTKCRLCAGDHREEDHTNEPTCRKCNALEESDGMAIDRKLCTHHLHCANCSTASHVTEKDHPADARRCPIRLEKYGTARTNERRALKTDNPWKVITSKKPRKPRAPKSTTLTSQGIPPEQLVCQNQFSIFDDPYPAAHMEEVTIPQ